MHPWYLKVPHYKVGGLCRLKAWRARIYRVKSIRIMQVASKGRVRVIEVEFAGLVTRHKFKPAKRAKPRFVLAEQFEPVEKV